METDGRVCGFSGRYPKCAGLIGGMAGGVQVPPAGGRYGKKNPARLNGIQPGGKDKRL